MNWSFKRTMEAMAELDSDTSLTQPERSQLLEIALRRQATLEAVVEAFKMGRDAVPNPSD